MATIVKYETSDWQSEAFRRETLKEARKEARNARKRVIIKVGSTKMGYRTVATVDGRFYVGKITTLGILFLTACSGEAFHGGVIPDNSNDGQTEVSARIQADSGQVETGSTSTSGTDDSGILDGGTRIPGTGGRDSGTPGHQDSGNGGTGVRLTCPESVDSCDGKAWNGKVCEGIYSVCCNGELCSCCLG